MMENQDQQPTTNGVNVPAPVIEMREKLPTLLASHIPWMEQKNKVADDLLDTITEINSDEEAEDVTARLAGIRAVGEAISKKRLEMTRITDAFKDMLMEYERPFDAKNEKSKYNQKRKILETYQEKKLQERRKQEQEIAKRKELENHKVDLRTKMLENLTQMITNRLKQVDSGSKDFFDAGTVDNFDERATQYKNNKPKLKQTDYDACFDVSAHVKMISASELGQLIEDVKKEETYDKWNTEFVEKVSPIINEWRAKIPDLKQEKITLAEASKKSADEAARIKAEQDAKAQKEHQERQAKLDEEAKVQQDSIAKSAELDKMSNSFAAQASEQNLEDAGGVKLVMRFKDDTQIPKPLMNIIYHCMSSPKFPGVHKRDKSKKIVVDDKGRKQYIDAIQWWLDFFVKNVDGEVEGVVIEEDARVVIRK